MKLVDWVEYSCKKLQNKGHRHQRQAPDMSAMKPWMEMGQKYGHVGKYEH